MSNPTRIKITAGPYEFIAAFEDAAPKTTEVFRSLLPYRQKLIRVCWSGEALWIPLGEQNFGLEFENHTAHPAAGQRRLASKMGSLAANHFLTIIDGSQDLKSLGKLVLYEGAQDVLFELAAEESSGKLPATKAMSSKL